MRAFNSIKDENHFYIIKVCFRMHIILKSTFFRSPTCGQLCPEAMHKHIRKPKAPLHHLEEKIVIYYIQNSVFTRFCRAFVVCNLHQDIAKPYLQNR